jgi:hypothetical protein
MAFDPYWNADLWVPAPRAIAVTDMTAVRR